MIKKWPLFLIATNPLPWLKNRFTLRFFGVKIGKNTICDNAWIFSEFVDIGDEVIIGMGSTVLPFGIEKDTFILRRIVIEDNALIGAKCSLMPGTKIRNGAKLSAQSFTKYNQVLKKNSLYMGQPAKLQT
jgi:carbonic anhydrase/acetyltransferase-like protein (isoleucine patch superfamily)